MLQLGRIAAGLVLGLVLGGAAAAAEAADEPYRVRGTLTEVADDHLAVETEDADTVELALTDETGIFVVRPASLDDIKQGDYIGVTSIEQQGRRVALAVHIFAEDLRGTAEGHFPWDLVKEPNTMTNATVAEVEALGRNRELNLTYKMGEGGEDEVGSQTIEVPSITEVVRLEKAADLSPLVPAKSAFLVVQDTNDGTPAAMVVVVGEGGATPPM
jgi:hypothetical protein